MTNEVDHKSAAEPPLGCGVRGWQPMDSAPKDGTEVRVIAAEGYTTAFWQDGFWFWISETSCDIAAGPEPKGWLPLDEAPNSKLSRGE